MMDTLSLFRADLGKLCSDPPGESNYFFRESDGSEMANLYE